MNIEKIKQDGVTQGELHLPFLDKEIMKVFKDADIDYVVWFMKNKNVKHINTDGVCVDSEFPKIVVFNPASVNEEHFKDYYSCRIISVNW